MSGSEHLPDRRQQRLPPTYTRGNGGLQRLRHLAGSGPASTAELAQACQLSLWAHVPGAKLQRLGLILCLPVLLLPPPPGRWGKPSTKQVGRAGSTPVPPPRPVLWHPSPSALYSLNPGWASQRHHVTSTHSVLFHLTPFLLGRTSEDNITAPT